MYVRTHTQSGGKEKFPWNHFPWTYITQKPSVIRLYGIKKVKGISQRNCHDISPSNESNLKCEYIRERIT